MSSPGGLLSGAVSAMREAVFDAVAVLAPVECAGCGAADRALCLSCRRLLATSVEMRLLGDGTRVFTALAYEGVARAAILAFKHQGRTDVAHALAAPLARAIEIAVRAVDCRTAELLPVPSTRAAFRKRGYHPVTVLLKCAGLPRSGGVLVSSRDHDQQKLLGREARQHNLAGTMLARRSLRGRTFILVDDVITTGATLEETSRAVRAAGGEVLCAVVLANTAMLAGHFASSQRKPVTSPDDGTTVSERGAQVNPGSAGGDAPR